MAALPLIPSAVIGSHGKPGWWFATVKKVEAGEYGPGDLDEMFDDAADAAIRDMERAGLDIITDGEVRRLDGYVDSYYAIIKGISPLSVRRKAGPWGYDQQTRYEAVGRIETPEAGLGIVKEFEYLKAHTTKATKAAVKTMHRDSFMLLLQVVARRSCALFRAANRLRPSHRGVGRGLLLRNVPWYRQSLDDLDHIIDGEPEQR